MDLRKALWAVSIVCGLLYLSGNLWSLPGHVVIKGLSVSTMAAAAFLTLPAGRNRTLLTAALAFSSLGDILLDVSSRMFVFGLGSFLLAHLCYIPLYLKQRRKGETLGLARTTAALGLIAFSAVFFVWLLPGLGAMAVPVLAYVTVLTGMVIASLFWKGSTNWVTIGAVLFLISDAVLGANRFREPVPFRGWIVWGTYYAAQYLIAKGALRELAASQPVEKTA